MPSPAPQTKTAVTNTTTCNNSSPTFNSSSNSTIRSPSPRWRSFNNSSRQRTPYQYGNTPRNNYPRQFSQNSNGNFFGNSPQNPQTPSSSSTQNWPQFNQRPRFIPRQHMRMNRPRSSVQNQSNGTNQETNSVTECKTRKRKLKSQQSGEPQRAQKPWNREDAVKAIAAEMELRTPKNNQQIMIRFPDHEITRQIVQGFHTDIKSVHFHTPCNPRYCYVQVQPTANIETVANALNDTIFQHEKLRVEIKESQFEEKAFPECIDPYTLYLGNLPTNITSNAVKDEFPKATRVDIGFAKKMKYTRYAFIKFSNAEDAIQAYKEKYNLVIDSRSVVLRFRRGKGNVNPPGQVDKLPNEMNEFDMQSLRKKIKREPIEENIDEYDPPPINVSRVVKPEMIEEDDYENDSVYESHVSYGNDINIKSECPDYDDEYDEQYYEDEITSNVSYTFRKDETVTMDVVLAENNSAQCIQTNHNDDIAIPPGIEDEDRQWNEKLDDEEEFGMPYTFVQKNNRDITLPLTDEMHDGGSDREDQRWNNSSDDDDDGDGAEYSWQGMNEKNSSKQTKDYEKREYNLKKSDDIRTIKWFKFKLEIHTSLVHSMWPKGYLGLYRPSNGASQDAKLMHVFSSDRRIIDHKTQVKKQIIWTFNTSSLLFSNPMYWKKIYFKDPFRHSSASRTLYVLTILILYIRLALKYYHCSNCLHEFSFSSEPYFFGIRCLKIFVNFSY